jgi:hypothetical protein
MNKIYKMSSIFYSIEHIFNRNKSEISNKFDSFDLISKMPYQEQFNKYKFIQTVHKTDNIPENGKIINADILCADDIAYNSCKIFTSPEVKALGIDIRLRSAMMQAAQNLACEKAQYIVFTSNLIGKKYNNPYLVVLKNNYINVENNMRIEYNIDNYIIN